MNDRGERRLCAIGLGLLLAFGLLIAAVRPYTTAADVQKSGIVDGSPLYYSAYAAPDDRSAGGYDDAVDYNDNVCSGKSSTWTFKNGYVFWSTRSKMASSTKTTLYRSIGWDITFSADLNGNNTVDAGEQVTISVARTIGGEYLPNMNYYYINLQQKETDGVWYEYSLYAMSYDRLQELAKNHEAEGANGRTPVTDAIFSSEKIRISIDTIMTTVSRDANGKEDVKGCVVSENGTGSSGVSASANGTLVTSGTIYHCNNKADYDWLSDTFGEGSISTYRNSGDVKNYKLVIEYYTDAKTYGAVGTDGWSVNGTTGQICYKGSPYVEERSLWADETPAALGNVITGEGYTLTGAWRCGTSDCLLREGETYHISYLAQYASYATATGGIYAGNGKLKLYAEWKENEYTIEYYTKVSADADTYTKVASASCVYGKSYKYKKAAQTSAPVIRGVELLGWSEGTGRTASVQKCGASFSQSDYPRVAEKTGCVIKLYAVWGITPYTITCKETAPSAASHRFYEIYGVGFTTDQSLAGTTQSYQPYYWTKHRSLVQASELLLTPPVVKGYTWNGFWDEERERQYFQQSGKAFFSSAQTFVEDTTLYGSWKKNYTLTVTYQLGDNVSVTENAQGYGIDSDGYLTVDKKTYRQKAEAGESIAIPDILNYVQKTGCTASSQWAIAGTEETVAGGTECAAKVLAKRAGGDLAGGDVSIVLTLSWSPVRYYVDYFFWNDAAGRYEVRATQECLYGTTYLFYTEQQIEGVCAPDGKSFAGWSLDTEGAQVVYLGGEEFLNLCSRADARLALYGVWESRICTIALMGNRPSDADSPVVMGTEQIYYIYGAGFYGNGDSGELQQDCTVWIPSCKGYVFRGFFSAQEGGTLMIDASGHSTDDLSYFGLVNVLYAQWEPETYRMTFYANGGRFADSSWGSAQAVTLGGIAYGSFLPATVSPVREGYSFGGYATDTDGTGAFWYDRYLNSGDLRYRETGDTSLYANWVDDILPTGIIHASAGTSSSAWTNQNVRLSITGSDSGSGVVKIQLYQKRYYETAYRLVGEWNTAPTQSYTAYTTVSTNGISSFYCIVWDAVGNTNRRAFGADADTATSGTTTIYVDKVAPQVTAPEVSGSSAGNSARVSLYASDDAIE